MRDSDDDKKRIKLVITGGGTGGHVYPALAVAAELAAMLASEGRADTLDLLYVGSRAGMEEDLVRRQGLAFHGIASGPLRGKGAAQVPVSALRMLWGLGQALVLLRRHRTRAVLATGGYVCVPVVLAARATGVPVLIYLPDVEPGWAIRFLARFANCVAVTSSAAVRFLAARRVVETGYPVRWNLATIAPAEARQRLGLAQEAPVLLVLGGSRGAHAINRGLSEVLEELLVVAQIVHVCGPQDEPWLDQRRHALPVELQARYHLHGYLHAEIPFALRAADLVVSRAGASVLGEYPAAGLPSVLVPYPHAGSHQRHNATLLAETGSAVVLDNERLNELLPSVRALLGDRPRLAAMAAAAARQSRPAARQRIAALLLRLAGEREHWVAVAEADRRQC